MTWYQPFDEFKAGCGHPITAKIDWASFPDDEKIYTGFGVPVEYCL